MIEKRLSIKCLSFSHFLLVGQILQTNDRPEINEGLVADVFDLKFAVLALKLRQRYSFSTFFEL